MKTKSTDSQACGWFGVFTPFAGNPRLSEATWHQTPLTPFGSISHTTLGFEKALRIGYRGIRRQIDERLSAQTPERLLRRVAAIQRLGGGIVVVYNDDRIIPNLVHFGYPIEEARNYANDGCWEILVPGKTSFGHQPFDALLLLQEALGLSSSKRRHSSNRSLSVFRIWVSLVRCASERTKGGRNAFLHTAHRLRALLYSSSPQCGQRKPIF